MKKTWVIYLIIALSLLGTACQSLEGVPQPLAHRKPALYQAGLTSTSQQYLSVLEKAPVYEAEIEIAPSYQMVSGELRVYYINNEEVPLAEIYFRLFPNYNGGKYQIEEVMASGEQASWEFESEETALRVDLPDSLSPGEEQELKIVFSLSIPEEMGGNYEIFGYHDGIMALDNMLPSVPVYDELGWHIAYPAKTGDLPFVDPGFYHLIITAPQELVIVSSGIETLIEEDTEKKQKKVEIFAGPIRDFYLSASPLFTVETINLGETMINSYALPDTGYSQKLAMELSSQAISVFNEQIGAYPYTEFDIVASPVGTAMEYPGIIAIGLDKYGLIEDPYGRSAADLMPVAIVHETAHQWFYNMLGTDQVNFPWLDESFAVFLTHLYFQEIEGDAWGYDNAIGKSWTRVDREKIPVGMPTNFYKKHEYSPIVYARGMMFLLALENKIGEEIFSETLKDYFQAYVWEEISPDDFKYTAELNCGCDLSELWKEWIYPQQLD